MMLSSFSANISALPHPDVMRVVCLNGSHYDMGYQYGQQVGDYVEVCKHWFWMVAHSTPFLKMHEKIMADLARYEAVIAQVAPEFLEEMHGAADGAQAAGYDVTYEDVLLINCWFEMAYARPVEETNSCSSFGAWGSATKDGAPIFAHNRDGVMYPFLYQFIMIVYPKGRHAYISESHGGFLTTNWGMNDHGLTATCQTGPAARHIDRAFGMVHVLMIQHILETCSTAEEAKDYILNPDMPKSRGNSFSFLDKNKMYIVETTAANNAVRQAGDFDEQDFMVMANHYLTKEMQDAQGRTLEGVFPVSEDSLYRYASVYQLVKKKLGNITPEIAMDILSHHDYWDLERNRWVEDPSTGRSPCKHGRTSGMDCTNTSHIVLPKDLTYYVCCGNPCGTWPSDGLLGYDGYVELQLKGSPSETTAAAKDRAIYLLSLASDLLRTENKLSPELAERIQRALWENVEGCTAETLGDYSDATTHFSKAQAYARYAINKSTF